MPTTCVTTAYQQSDFRRYSCWSCLAALGDEVYGDPHVLRWSSILAIEAKLLPMRHEVKAQREGLPVTAAVAAAQCQARCTCIWVITVNALLDARAWFAEHRRRATPLSCRHCSNHSRIITWHKALEIRLTSICSKQGIINHKVWITISLESTCHEFFSQAARPKDQSYA